MEHSLSVLGCQGDTKIIWDPDKDAEVENAKRTFDDLRRKGYLAFRVTGRGDKGEQISTFDKHAEKLILAPQMRGGC